MSLFKIIKQFLTPLFPRHEGEKKLLSRFEKIHGRPFDEKRIETFSEKLLQQMLSVNRTGNRTFTRLADKYLVREYVEKQIGAEYLVTLIWSGKDPKQIPFESLPKKCVIKTNHGSGGNIVATPEIDKNKAIRTLSEWLGKNYYWVANEYHYFQIPPRILVEEFLDDGIQDGPLDYRVWCFNGVPEFIQVDNSKHSINNFYDTTWKKLDIRYREDMKEMELEKPKNLPKMLFVAEQLSMGIDFVRVDLYNIDGRIYFGEMTFTPVGGHMKFKPDFWDKKIGEKWAPKRKAT